MEKRILSIQSNVVNGYVGNKCACFTLQTFGFDVHPMNTVEVANHSGYPMFRGTKFDKSHFEDLFCALSTNELDSYDFILSGYMGKPESVVYFGQKIKELKSKQNIIYCTKQLTKSWIQSLEIMENYICPWK